MTLPVPLRVVVGEENAKGFWSCWIHLIAYYLYENTIVTLLASLRVVVGEDYSKGFWSCRIHWIEYYLYYSTIVTLLGPAELTSVEKPGTTRAE